MRVPLVMALLLITGGCTGVTLRDHQAAPDPAHPPTRILVVNGVLLGEDGTLRQAFAGSMTSLLAQCQVAANVFTVDGMTLDAPSKRAEAERAFRPDAILSIQLEAASRYRRTTAGTDEYSVRLRSLAAQRELWRGNIHLRQSMYLGTDVLTITAGQFAKEIIRSMATDGVLTSCPASVRA